MAVLEVKNLTKVINGKTILDNITLDINEGEICGLIGRNGSGKSMFFKAICGLINPTSGEIKVLDKVIANGEFPEDTGILIENPGLLPQYSAFRNLKIVASINNKIDDNKIRETIDMVGLDSKSRLPVKKYSLGMKQKLGIAMALMEEPKFLILDEPLNGLDEESVEDMRKLLKDLAKEKGVAIILASHNKDDIEILCDKIYKIAKGKITDFKVNNNN